MSDGFRAPLPARGRRFVACFADVEVAGGGPVFPLSTPIRVLEPEADAR